MPLADTDALIEEGRRLAELVGTRYSYDGKPLGPILRRLADALARERKARDIAIAGERMWASLAEEWKQRAERAEAQTEALRLRVQRRIESDDEMEGSECDCVWCVDDREALASELDARHA